MKKNLMAAAVCAALFTSSAFAFNANNMYVNANGGLYIPGSGWSSFYKNGYNLGLATGYHFTKNLRAELAFNYAYNEFDLDGYDIVNWNQYFLMANGYYDFVNSTNFVPYVGLGVGMNHMTGKFFAGSAYNRTYFAAQAIVGMDYKLNKQVSLGLNDHITFTRDSDTRTNIYSNMVNASFTYNF